MLLSAIETIPVKSFDVDLVMLGIAIAAFVSPIFVAWINNFMQRDNRKMELEHEIAKKKLDIENETEIRKYESYYKCRADAYKNMLYEVGVFLAGGFDHKQYAKTLGSVSIADGYADNKLRKELELLRTELLEFHEKANQNVGSYPEVEKQLSEIAKIISESIKVQ